MKTTRLLLLIFSVAYLCGAPTRVNAQSYNNEELVLFDDFNDNSYGWTLKTYGDVNSYIRSGKLYCKNSNDDDSEFIPAKINLDNSRDYYVEAKLRFVEGTAGYGITTGYLDNNNLVRFIVTDRDGQYFIQQTENGTANILTGWKNNSLVKMKNAMNVFRIEKKGSKVYFYMNGSLAETHPYTKFKGGNISLFCGPTSTIEVEYVKVAYTDGRGNNNQYVNNYTNNQNQNQNLTQNVEIDVREPELERGFKSVRLKTLRVAGFIKTTGSVTQVLINGLDAFLAADGYFSIEVPLMPGDNTVNIKATDSNFKTVTKTFSAKREY